MADTVAGALGSTYDDRAVPLLLEALKDPVLRASAAQGLARLGDLNAVHALKELLEDDESSLAVRVGAAETLCTLGDSSGVPVLIKALYARGLATAAWHGYDCSEAVPRLIQTMAVSTKPRPAAATFVGVTAHDQLARTT